MKNYVEIIGHIGQIEHRNVNGSTLVKLSIATNEGYRNEAGEWIDQTEWHSIEAWQQLADRIKERGHKGDLVLVEGKLRTQSYQNQDGQTVYRTIIRANTFRMLNQKSGNSQSNSEASTEAYGYSPKYPSKSPVMNIADGEPSDDLPF